MTDPMTRTEFTSKDLILKIDMTVPAEVGGITPVVERIMGAVTQMECAAGHETEVELALQEALANAVVHGCDKDPPISGCSARYPILVRMAEITRRAASGFRSAI